MPSSRMHGRRKWQPTPVLFPGKSHGQRSLVGYRPWGRKESDTTEATQPLAQFDLWKPNQLQRSCLEQPTGLCLEAYICKEWVSFS